MATVTVTDKALRELVREAMFNKDFGGWSSNIEGPANVDPVVDPSQAVTDPINPDFTPKTKTEFGVAVNNLVKNLPDTEMPKLFDIVKSTVDQTKNPEEESKMADKKVAGAGTGAVEESVRKAVRKILADMNPRWNAVNEAPPKKLGPVVGPMPPVRKIPAGEHGGEYQRHNLKHRSDLKKWLHDPKLDKLARTSSEIEDDEAEQAAAAEAGEDVEATPEAPKRNYKQTSHGGMTDVGGAKFEDIATELGLSVAGAKRVVDQTLMKLDWIQKEYGGADADELILNAIHDYIDHLASSEELSYADIQLMKDHPEIVSDLPGFVEYIDAEYKVGRNVKYEEPEGEPSSEEISDVRSAEQGVKPAAQTAAVPAAKAAPTLAARKSKDSYKVYPWKGKRSVIRIGDKLYGTGEGGKLPDGNTTKFAGGERANTSREGDKLKVSKPDSDHTQTWDVVESKRPVLFSENTAATVSKRKSERPELYCPKCLWMTGGGACPRHGGPAWSKEREEAARAKSRASKPSGV